MNSDKQLLHSRMRFTVETVRAFFWLVVLAFLLCLPQSRAAVGDTFTDDNFKYTVLTEKGTTGTVSVAKQSNTIPSGAVTIPNTVTLGPMTYNVTGIATTAFIACNGLTGITISDSVVSIGVAAFSKCSSLVNITISDSVTNIGGSAFVSCSSLMSITIPDSVTSIDVAAFAGCSSLENVLIGKNVTSIGNNAFQYCTSLTNIIFKANPPSMGRDVFYNCTELETIYYKGDSSGWTNPWNSLTTIALKPEDICIISAPVDQMVLSNTDASFAVSAFSPAELSYQWYKDGFPIEGATSPAYFIVNAQGEDSGSYTVTMSNEYASAGRQATLDVVTERTGDPDSDFQYTLDGRTATITGYLGTKKIVTIPNIVEGCLVTRIGDHAFAGCSGLTSITIPDSATSIERGAFRGCASLTSVIIPNKVTFIGDHAFYGCSGLTNVYFKGDAPSIGGSHVFSGCKALETIYYIEGTTGWTNPWEGIATAAWVPELVYTIAGGKLVLSWAASSGATLEVSGQAGGGLWTHAGEPEVEEGICYYEAPITSGTAYYRLVIE
ncbi:MAG: leucine-rich repeat protein [Limisphaerales bacterium]|jgi:hypothetical protein|nr:leucine-rich repeat protein [Verrucomicrobiota bacterium]